MFIEAFTVCINYSDFLDFTLSLNKKHFDKWLIVTTPEDVLTKQVCKKHDVQYVETNRIYENKAKFNKGKAVNDALQHLAKKDWLIHIDADIILPDDFRETLDNLTLNPDFLYGAIREEIDGSKILKSHDPGADPIGYFQMFTTKSTALKNKHNFYPENFHNAGGYDKAFVNYWEPQKIKILDFKILHIEHGKSAINWNGRKSTQLTNNMITAYSYLFRKLGKKQPLL